MSNQSISMRIHNWFFPSDYSINLHHSPRCINKLFYIRLVAFIYLSAIFLWTIIQIDSVLNLIIYLTMNGYFFTWLYFCLIMQDYYLNVSQAVLRKGNGYPLCQNLKYYIYLIYQIAFSIELPITLVFWGVLFQILLNMDNITTQIIIINANLHAGPFICLLIQVFYNTCQFPRKHFAIVVCSSTIYLFINMAYSLSVKPIYKPIDYISIFSYVLLVASVLLSYLMHWFGRFLFKKLKKKILENRIMEGLIQNNFIAKDKGLEQQTSLQIKKNRKQSSDKVDTDLNVSVLTDDL